MSIIKLAQGFKRRLILKQTYKEQVTYNHYQGRHANFDCILTPLKDATAISLETYLIKENVLYPTHYYETILTELWEIAINEKALDGIGFEGFSIKIIHNKFYSDTSPVSYKIAFTNFLGGLFEEDIFDFKIITPEMDSTIFNFKKIETDNDGQPSEKFMHFTLPLPKIYDKALVFKETWLLSFLIKSRFWIPNFRKTHFVHANISTSTGAFRRENHIYFRFPKNIDLQFSYFIIKQLEQFKNHIYKELKMNLGGISITLDIEDIEYLSDFTYCDSLFWALKNFITDEQNITIQERIYYASTEN